MIINSSKLRKRILGLLLVLAGATAMSSQAQVVLYRETFGNNLGGTTASVNWRYLNNAAATDISSNAVFGNASVPGTNLANVSTSVNSSQTNGHWGPTIGTIALLYPNSTEQLAFSGVDLNPVDYSSLTFSWYSAVTAAPTTQRLALQIGSSWYATDATYVNVIGAGSFATLAVQESVVFNPNAALWRDLTVTPGSTLSLSGSARLLNLPSGSISNFGILSEGGGTSRVDTFQVSGVAVPEPSTWALLGFGFFAFVLLRRQQKL